MKNKIILKLGSILTYTIYWIINGLFVFNLFFFLIWFITNSISTTREWYLFLQSLTDFLPLDLIIILVLFLFTPLISILLAIFTRSLNRPHRLRQILFGFQLPVMAFTLARLIFFKDINSS